MSQKRSTLSRLQSLGREGRYREAIRLYLESSGFWSDADLSHADELTTRLQYAIALQHPGFYHAAREIYEEVARDADVALADGRLSADCHAVLQLHVDVQLAVLLERLERPTEALERLNNIEEEIRQPNVLDLGLASASLLSWVDMTRMRALLATGNLDEASRCAGRCVANGDWNQKLWGRVVEATISLLQNSLTGDPQVTELRAATVEMRKLDQPGLPWLGLTAGRALRDVLPEVAEELLRVSESEAAKLGKFFNVASACEQLHYVLRRRGDVDEAGYFLRRAAAAYSRCSILLTSPFRSRIFSAARAAFGDEQAQQLFMVVANLLPPSGLVFAEMCARRAREGSRGSGNPGKLVKPWQVFESFARDWALTRYPGKLLTASDGLPTADVVIADGDAATLIQAKHYRRPRQAKPKRLRLRELAERFGLRIIRYVFLVTTSDPAGWHDRMWHFQDSEDIRNLVPDPSIRVDVFDEPTLQMDTLLSDFLYERYFREGP